MIARGRHIRITGTVQGVGFRPFVYRLARDAGLTGRVRNGASGVTIEAYGTDGALDVFLARLASEPPPAARIAQISWRPLAGDAPGDFVIEGSDTLGEKHATIPPDLATCDTCLSEVLDPGDRRYRYPFTNCTDCGPRLTIVRSVPYDRPKTTMASFEMCEDCRREYEDPSSRRFHAQPNACPRCGPSLSILSAAGKPVLWAEPLWMAARALESGRIVAVKGLGGFHLACDATREPVVSLLRRRKHRDEKPFAVMAEGLEAARALAEIDDAEAALLTSVERPIVLVRRRDGSPIADAVAPGLKRVGLMLPYTPLHHLLLREVERPLVMTSANLSDEPTVYRDDEVVPRLGDVADLLLVHDRAIAMRVDDSVARVVGGRPMIIRRSRGFVPRPVTLRRRFARPVLACGAHLKNTFCIGVGNDAYLGPHIGDLETLEAYESLSGTIERMERFLDVRPEVVAHDLHPGYLSTRYAESRDGVVHVGVQHHHAHVASAMAEHGLTGPVLGVAYDGTGAGPDGTAWGGELLLADEAGFERIATFRPIPLAGADRAIHAPWRIALALLDDAFEGDPPLSSLPVFRGIPHADVGRVRRMIETGLNSPLAHGVGRYFDALAALGLDRPIAAYEGQLAILWEEAADPEEHGRYLFALDLTSDPWEVDLRPLVRQAVGDLIAGRPASVVSARFHETLIHVTTELLRAAAERRGRAPVVLTGGCFQNARLALGVARELRGELRVHLHQEVPPGDGGLALGQALVADAVARRLG